MWGVGRSGPTMMGAWQLGQNLVDPDRAIPEIADIVRSRLERAKNYIKRKLTSPRKPNIQNTIHPRLRPKTKSMDMEPTIKDHEILVKLLQSPKLKNVFTSIEQIYDFCNEINEQELRIIIDSNDANTILKIKQQIDNDLEDTAKQLSIED